MDASGSSGRYCQNIRTVMKLQDFCQGSALREGLFFYSKGFDTGAVFLTRKGELYDRALSSPGK